MTLADIVISKSYLINLLILAVPIDIVCRKNSYYILFNFPLDFINFFFHSNEPSPDYNKVRNCSFHLRVMR